MKCNYVEPLLPAPLQAPAHSVHFCCSEYNVASQGSNSENTEWSF